MKRRFSLFTYPMMDMKAAEAELNRRAAAGWQLEKVWMGVLAVFVPAHVPVCYCIDWSDPGRDDGPGYRALLADAGRLLLRLGQWRRGADGRNLPAPGRWSALTAAVCDLADRLVLGAACLTFLMDVVQSALRGEWLLLLAAHTRWIEEPYRVEFKVYAGGEDCGQLDASLALAGGLDGGVVQETTGGRWATASGGG